MARSVCLDFDGVMNTYAGWKGADELFEPREGLGDFLRELRDRDLRVVVHSTRSASRIKAWLAVHDLADLVDDVVDIKPMAIAYVDDRAVPFTGAFTGLADAVETFKTHWETP